MALKITPNPDTGASHYEIPGAGSFELPAIGTTESTKLPVVFFHGTAANLGDFAANVKSIREDVTLSELGRQLKLDPLKKEIVLGIASLDSSLDVEERYLDKREQALLAVPQIDQGHSVAAIEAREARDWFRALPAAKQNEMLQKMDEEPGHDVMLLALIRSPIPQLDRHALLARSIWDRSRRLANPSEALEIEQGRANVEWARRGAAHLAGMAKSFIGWNNDQIVRTVLTSDNEMLHISSKVFGISPRDVEQMKRVLAYESRKGN